MPSGVPGRAGAIAAEDKAMRTVWTRSVGQRGGLWAFLLAAFAVWPPGGAGPTPAWAGEGARLEDRMPRPPGGELLRSRGCLDCHRLGEKGNPRGVDLYNVGRHLDDAAIERLLRHPQDVNPGATMPSPFLTRWEALAIAAFISRLP